MQTYGAWVYALLFLIIFVETGVVVMPFLPGDSLLFVVGALCGAGLMNLPLVMVLLVIAAVLGNQCNYAIGRYFGPQVFQWENSRFFNRKAFDQAHAFYEKYGGITIVVARFMPFLRTFAPFVAGVAADDAQQVHALRRDRRRCCGCCSLTLAGYFVRQHPVGQGEPRQDHLGRDPDAGPAGADRRLARAAGRGARGSGGDAGRGTFRRRARAVTWRCCRASDELQIHAG